ALRDSGHAVSFKACARVTVLVREGPHLRGWVDGPHVADVTARGVNHLVYQPVGLIVLEGVRLPVGERDGLNHRNGSGQVGHQPATRPRPESGANAIIVAGCGPRHGVRVLQTGDRNCVRRPAEARRGDGGALYRILYGESSAA